VEKTLVSRTGFERLVELVKTLRSEEGCPWDRAQTAEKIKVYLIEEAYEVLDAIDASEPQDVCGELGDLLFHIVFLARIFEEAGAFDMEDVLGGITEKMTRRHPHVFGEAQVGGVRDVKIQWQEIKVKEKKEAKKKESSPFDTIPLALPALLRAYRLGERAAGLGEEQWDLIDVLHHIEDEYRSLKTYALGGEHEQAAERFGELLFALVTFGRVMGIHPENALSQALGRFVERYKLAEESLKKGKSPTTSPTD